MEFTERDWAILEQMRTAFLDGTAGEESYWQSENDVDCYDQTFAERIGWKWRFVLSELRRRAWLPPNLPVLDYACGSGIAGRTFLREFGAENFSAFAVFDRSNLAMNFAEKKAKTQFPTLHISTKNQDFTANGIVLISHLITELNEGQITELVEKVRSAEVVIWVEPGTYAASRALLSARERLRKDFYVVAPCSHRAECGMTHPVNRRHWCHFFADSPEEAFTTRDWSRFAAMMNINLSDLPLSYLVLDKRSPVPLAPHSARVIARPNISKHDAVVLLCNERGVKEKLVEKRRFPDDYRAFKKGDFDSLQSFDFL